MWHVLQSLTDNKLKNIRIIIGNGKDCLSQRLMANAFINTYKYVSSLKLAKVERGVNRIPNEIIRPV